MQKLRLKCIAISITFVSEQILTCLYVWLTETLSDQAIIADGVVTERDRRVAGESWSVSYFRNAGEEIYWSGHLDLIRTSGLRGAKQSLSTPPAAVVQKIYLLPHQTPPTHRFLFFPLYLALSCQRWKENLISIRLNCGGQHYQFKRPGDLTASTPRWLITSQQWWAPLSPLSLCCCSGDGGGWRQHMISAALITGLTGKRPRQHWCNASQSHPLHPTGPGKLSRYMPFVYSLVRDRKVQCSQLSVWCQVK